MRKHKPDDCLNPEWQKSRTDPVREELTRLGNTPYLDSIRERAPAAHKAAGRVVAKGFDRYMAEDWGELYLDSIEEGMLGAA